MEKVKKYLLLLLKIAVVYFVADAAGKGVRILTGILEGQHGAPSFVTPAFSYYGILVNILSLIAFFLLANLIPVKGSTVKGVLFFLLFWGSAYFPQVLGMSGGESAYLEKEAFSIGTICADSAGYLIKGLAVGFFLAKKEKPEKKSCNRKEYLLACLTSMLLFPAVLGLFELAGGAIWPILYCVKTFSIASGQYISFYIVFYLFQAVSGFLFPVFYRMTEYNAKGSWLRFASIYAWLLWLPVVLIMILFGVEALPTLIWGAAMTGAIYLDVFVFDRIMKHSTKEQ